ncbi:hypothetical protein GCM10017691_30780 [Pseudonocardia petroleophila]
MLTLGSVLNVADAVLFLLALVNIIGLYILAPVVRKEVISFRDRMAGGEVRELDRSEKVDG